jgi:hypothetical protein
MPWRSRAGRAGMAGRARVMDRRRPIAAVGFDQVQRRVQVATLDRQPNANTAGPEGPDVGC